MLGAFPGGVNAGASLLSFGPLRGSAFEVGRRICLPPRPRALGRTLPSVRSPCPSASPRRSSANAQRGNVNPLSIACAFRPRLRPRLTLGGQAFPRKPWAFDGGDSHPPLATHANILPSRRSTGPRGPASAPRECPPTAYHIDRPAASVTGLSPVHLRRAGTRPVGCYAVLGWVAASEPTSWLAPRRHLLSHLTCPSGP